MTKYNPETLAKKDSLSAKIMKRKQFLELAGVAALTTTVISCKRNDLSDPTIPYANTDNTIDFKDDIGLLNYIYVLEQLEAAFYIKVAEGFPSGFTATQALFFADIKLHEIAHREFFKRVLGSAAVGTLEVDFSTMRWNILGSSLRVTEAALKAYRANYPYIAGTNFKDGRNELYPIPQRERDYNNLLGQNNGF